MVIFFFFLMFYEFQIDNKEEKMSFDIATAAQLAPYEDEEEIQ